MDTKIDPGSYWNRPPNGLKPPIKYNLEIISLDVRKYKYLSFRQCSPVILRSAIRTQQLQWIHFPTTTGIYPFWSARAWDKPFAWKSALLVSARRNFTKYEQKKVYENQNSTLFIV